MVRVVLLVLGYLVNQPVLLGQLVLFVLLVLGFPQVLPDPWILVPLEDPEYPEDQQDQAVLGPQQPPSLRWLQSNQGNPQLQ